VGQPVAGLISAIVVARLSGHRTAAVFKRYDIVDEQDFEATVQVLSRSRAPLGHDSDTVDGK
jgi:hypothetical protein